MKVIILKETENEIILKFKILQNMICINFGKIRRHNGLFDKKSNFLISFFKVFDFDKLKKF